MDALAELGNWLYQRAALDELLVSTLVFGIIWVIANRKLPEIGPLIHKTGVTTDLCYWLTNRLIANPLIRAAIIFVFADILRLGGIPRLFPSQLEQLYLPLEVLVCMLAYDFFAYWRHRWTHSDLLWPIHAPHHSSTHINWMSGLREHFLDIFFIIVFGGVLMTVIGFSPAAIAITGLIRTYWVAFVHMDLAFSLGPLDYVIVTPRFHRWHHVQYRKGGQNYSGFFSFFDLLFGTFYLPKDKLASKFGTGEPNYPDSFKGQILQPFRVYWQRLR